MISPPTHISQTQTQFAMVLDELKIHTPNSETSPGRAVIQSIQAARNDPTEVHGTRPKITENEGRFKSANIDPTNATPGPVSDSAKKLTQVMEGVTLSDRISGSTTPPTSTKLNDKRCVTPPLSSSQNTKIISSPGSAFMSPSRSTELTGSSIRQDTSTTKQRSTPNQLPPPPIKWDEQLASRSSASLLRKPLSSSSRESPHVLPTLKSTHSLYEICISFQRCFQIQCLRDYCL